MIEAIHKLSGTELLEGITVSLFFVVVPVLAHAETRHRKREREADRRHQETLDAHTRTHDLLKGNQ